MSFDNEDFFAIRCVWVNGPIIIGAGPSGLAVGAGLKTQGVPFLILERSNCIASLWKNRTYDRLKLHLPKEFCQLPDYPFPDEFPLVYGELPQFQRAVTVTWGKGELSICVDGWWWLPVRIRRKSSQNSRDSKILMDQLSMLVSINLVHVLPREILGKSTFKLGVFLMKLFPVRIVDKILILLGRMVLGDIERYGLTKPSIGPLEQEFEDLRGEA